MTLAVPAPPESLGISLQLAPLSSTQNIWHVLSIPSPLAPAFLAGLLPHSDYILGSPSGNLRGEAALGELVEDHLNRTLVLWAYNSEFDVVREVELVPRRGWGGDGALGAVLGYGALHRLPVGLGEEIQGPGEQLFDAEKSISQSNHSGDVSYFAQNPQSSTPIPFSPPPMVNPDVAPPPMVSPNAPPPGAAPSRIRKARHHNPLASPKSAFEDIFAEGAKKSAEEDFIPSRKGTPVAPPPKIGGPAASTQSSMNENAADSLDNKSDIGEPGDAEPT